MDRKCVSCLKLVFIRMPLDVTKSYNLTEIGMVFVNLLCKFEEIEDDSLVIF